MTVSHDDRPPADLDGEPGARELRFGRTGAGLAVAGAILGVVAFTVLPWFRQDGNSNHFADPSSQSRFGGLHSTVDRLQSEFQALSNQVQFGIAPAYFSWLGWTLLAAAFVLALLAVSPIRPGAVALRVLAGLVALTGVGLTLWALDLFSYDRSLGRYIGVRSASFGDYLGHGYFGFWAAVLAFVLIGAAALAGPRRPGAPRPG